MHVLAGAVVHIHHCHWVTILVSYSDAHAVFLGVVLDPGFTARDLPHRVIVSAHLPEDQFREIEAAVGAVANLAHQLTILVKTKAETVCCWAHDTVACHIVETHRTIYAGGGVQILVYIPEFQCVYRFFLSTVLLGCRQLAVLVGDGYDNLNGIQILPHTHLQIRTFLLRNGICIGACGGKRLGKADGAVSGIGGLSPGRIALPQDKCELTGRQSRAIQRHNAVDIDSYGRRRVDVGENCPCGILLQRQHAIIICNSVGLRKDVCIVGDLRVTSGNLIHRVGVGAGSGKGEIEDKSTVGIVGNGLNYLTAVGYGKCKLVGQHGSSGQPYVAAECGADRRGCVGVIDLGVPCVHGGL